MNAAVGLKMVRLLGYTTVFLCSCSILLLSTSFAAESGAETPNSALRAAEVAYQAVDWAAVYDAATRGLKSGGATLTESVALHVLAGEAAAVLGKSGEARQHFVVALAVQPTLKLEQDLAPKIRDPYLEALGYWGAHAERLGLRALYDAHLNRLTLRATDPSQLGAKLLIHSRKHGDTEFTRRAVDAKPRVYVTLARSVEQTGADYFVVLVDIHGNRLFECGNEDEPLSIEPQKERRTVALFRATAPSVDEIREKSQWLPLTLMGSGMLAGGAGGYFHFRREKAAQQWNGSGCERPGLTRMQQCGAVNAERTNWERLTIGSYALGGALIALGATVLWLGSNQPKDTTVASIRWLGCGLDVTGVYLGCSGHF